MGGKKTVGIVHSESYQLLRDNYKVLWVISLIVLGIGMVVGTIISVVSVPLQIAMQASVLPLSLLDSHIGQSMERILTLLVPVIGLFGGLYLLLMAVSVLSEIVTEAAMLGTYNATLQLMDGQKPSFQREWARFAANWKRYMAVYGWITLWTFLWGLLFIVPGIVKWYEYRMAPMLVLRYPDMTPRDALRISQNMTRGYKGRLFGIDCILFLYGLASGLAICCLIIGIFAAIVLWVTPMHLGMYSIVYRDILQAAIDGGHMPLEPADPLMV